MEFFFSGRSALFLKENVHTQLLPSSSESSGLGTLTQCCHERMSETVGKERAGAFVPPGLLA